MTRSCKIYPSFWNLRTEFFFPADLIINGCPKYFSWWAKILPSLYWIQLREGSEKTSAKNCQKNSSEPLVKKRKKNCQQWKATYWYDVRVWFCSSNIYKENDNCLLRPWGHLISIFLKLASNKFHFTHITQITTFSRKNPLSILNIREVANFPCCIHDAGKLSVIYLEILIRKSSQLLKTIVCINKNARQQRREI